MDEWKEAAFIGSPVAATSEMAHVFYSGVQAD
jgi:hypothetical protein